MATTTRPPAPEALDETWTEHALVVDELQATEMRLETCRQIRRDTTDGAMQRAVLRKAQATLQAYLAHLHARRARLEADDAEVSA